MVVEEEPGLAVGGSGMARLQAQCFGHAPLKVSPSNAMVDSSIGPCFVGVFSKSCYAPWHNLWSPSLFTDP